MSESDLISYRLISPNRHHPRNHKIDTITIHHMAGNLTVEQCGRIFQNVQREASSNYGIGTDGRIALYVSEDDRAWTSGSPANDHRAVTIEVANDGGAETSWHVSDKAIASLIDLLEDICRRNGIKKLVWSDKKGDRVGHKNGCNMTVHKDFQATACPGPYLYGKQAWIAQQVNKRLEGEEMSYETFKQYMKQYEAELAQQQASSWTKNEETGFDPIGQIQRSGVMVGDSSGNFRPHSYVKREELAAVAMALASRLKISL